MRSAIIYLTIFAFIIFAASFASRSEQVRRAAVLDKLRTVEIAEARQDLSQPRVLGAVTDRAPEARISVLGQSGQTALKILQDSHVVVVEYTQEGAVVKGIDGAGHSEDDRQSDKKWQFKVNGRSSQLPADRYMTRDDDVIVWEYM
jgi:hypothetical protein